MTREKLEKKNNYNRKKLERGSDPEKLEEKIYKILTNKRFRACRLPADEIKELIIKKIQFKVSNNLPIELFQFWGGSKNTNLPKVSADMCEESTLNNLNGLDNEIKKSYQPGLKIYILPGDVRVERVNLIPRERTENYLKTLTKISKKSKYNNLFKVISLSNLYKKYFEDFEKKLQEVKKRISNVVEKNPDFEKLIINARKNLFVRDLKTERKIKKQSIDSAKNYLIYRVAEEEANIFREFKNCIRSYFIRYIPFYKQYIKDINQTMPHLDCSLVFFTGGKGNITQPWQAIGKREGKKVLFLSQERLKNNY